LFAFFLSFACCLLGDLLLTGGSLLAVEPC